MTKRSLAAVSLVLGLTAVALRAQQAADIIFPNGSLDGSYALVDKDRDGKYATDGEAYDYIRAKFNTSPRKFVQVGTRLYFVEAHRDRVEWVEDTNANGRIEANERHTFYDAGKALGTCEPNYLTIDKTGWLWWTNDSGTAEGIYKSKDLNNDGDAEDTGETIGVLVEPKTVPIANAPNSTSVRLSVTALDSIFYDATYGANGRFICEEENYDQSIAFEDKNNDGDFEDPGECYLFCALYAGGTLGNDQHPDVANGKLPSANEIRDHVYDLTKKAYYLISVDTTATNTDAGIIFRGVDNNSDGDINDQGEVTVYWDGSLDSKGATKGYNFCYDFAHQLPNRLYVHAEWDASPDHERLLLLEDKNNDGDCNDANETKVLWDLPFDRTLYTPLILPPGTIKNPPSGKPAIIAYYGVNTCRSSAPDFHNIQFGYNYVKRWPVIGETLLVRTWGAATTAPGIHLIGATKIDPGVSLDQNKTCRLAASPDFLVLPFVTDATGVRNTDVPIPNDKSFIGAWTYWQSIVLDGKAPAGLGFTISDAFECRFGDYSYTR